MTRLKHGGGYIVECDGDNFKVIPRMKWVPGGYHYWTGFMGVYGQRQIGREFFCVVDDFGALVPVRPV